MRCYRIDSLLTPQDAAPPAGLRWVEPVVWVWIAAMVAYVAVGWYWVGGE